MIEDRRTKAQILADLERLSEENQKLRAAVPNRPAEVPEAEALAGCIRALDRLKDRDRSTYGQSNSVNRTILALCEKYGVPRFEKVTEPCERRHIEDMTAVDVLTAVKRDFEGYMP